MSHTDFEPRRAPAFKQILNDIGALTDAQLNGLAAALGEEEGFNTGFVRVRRLSADLRIDAAQVGLMMQVLNVVEQHLLSGRVEVATELPVAIRSLADLLDRSDIELVPGVFANVERLLARNAALDRRREQEIVRQGFGDEAVGFNGMVELRPTFKDADDVPEFVMVTQMQIILRSTNPNPPSIVVQLDAAAIELLQSCLIDLRSKMAIIANLPQIRTLK